MSETKKINSTDGKKGNSGNAAKYAGVGLGAAGVAAAGTAAAAHFAGGKEDVTEDPQVQENPQEDPQQSNPTTTTGHHTSGSHNSGHSSGNHTSGSGTTGTNTHVDNPEPEPDPIPDPEPEPEPMPEPEPEPEPMPEPEPEPEPIPEPLPEPEPINPDEIAAAIISTEEIDPNDIDPVDVINFQEIETVYAVNGDTITHASFQNAAGEEFVMVDIDGDNVFDYVTDASGNPVIDESGHMVSAEGMTVDDAEIQIADNNTYLAVNDTDNTSDFGSDTIVDDIVIS